jgi:dipeptidyl aminopeptidase/acylaminoacyl peptidase
MKPISFAARDGFKVRGYLTLPAGNAGSKPPLVVLPHGGPWLRDYWGFDSEVQFLANRGYAVLQVNFRGSAGFGRKFLEAGYQEWGAAMQDDVTDAVKWVIAEGLVDPDRVGIYGASYGGFAAMAGLCFTPELYRCGVNVCGVTDMRTLIQNLPAEKKLLRANMERLVGDPKEDSELLKRRSPQHNVERIAVPVLLAYGQEDTVVEIKQGDRFHRELKRNGKEVKYLVFPDEGHGFFRRENQLKFYGELEQFLDRHLKSAPPRKP